MLVVVKARTGMNKNGASSEQYVVHTLLALPLATWDVGSAESGDGRCNRTSPYLTTCTSSARGSASPSYLNELRIINYDV